VDIGYPSGWGAGLGNTPSRGLSVYGGLRVAYSGGGFITSDTSVRSPIFYDSDNTGYYVDPASTSNLNGLNLNGLSVGGRDMRRYGTNRYVEFTVNGDANTYYPVLLQTPFYLFEFAKWSITRHYADTAPWDPIGTGVHRGGLTLTWCWSGDGAWGGNDKSFRVEQFSESYTTMVGGMQLSVNGMIVWLRGGGAVYKFHGTGGMDNTVAVTLGTYTASNAATFPARSWVQSNIDSEIMARFPIRNSGSGGELWDGGTRVLSEDRWINSKYFGTNGHIHGSVFYDSGNTAFYANMDGTSEFNTIQTRGGSGFRSFATPAASINSQIYFADAGNTRAWNWQLDENNNAALWNYNGSGWAKRMGVTSPDSELYLRNSSGSDVSLAYPATFGYSSSYKTMVLGNQAYTTVCIGVSPASNPSGSFNGAGSGVEVMFKNGVYFISPNSANNSYNNYLRLIDGYVQFTNSARAPIH